MKSFTEKFILLLMAMALTLLPAFPDAVEDVDSHADVDPCGSYPADTCGSSACGGEPDPGDDNCCETGCQNCSLPCCSGTAMIATIAQGLDSALSTEGRLAASALDVTRIDPDPLFHPPRG